MLIRRLLITAFIFTLGACSAMTHIDESFYIDSSSNPWTSSLSTPGILSLELTPTPNSHLYLRLLPSSKRAQPDSLTLMISDRNCDTGFAIKIRHTNTEGEIIDAYFDHEVPWGETIALSLHVNNASTFSVRSGDQKLSGTLIKTIKSAELSVSTGSAEIHRLGYRGTGKKD